MMGPHEQVLQFSSARPAVHPDSAREQDELFSSLSGTSPAINQLRAQIRRVAPYFRVTALSGEPGCGETAAARSLHENGPLRDLRFLNLNAADAEEFFAPAHPSTEGIGLIFLAEADKLSVKAQNGVLRFLRHQGHSSPRLAAYVGRGLKALISAGFFSPELAGSLGSLRILLPTLRERAADITLLLHDALQLDRRRNGNLHRPIYLSDDFLNAAVRFSWPGNLHQLQDVVRWLLEHKAGGTLQTGDLLAAIEALTPTPLGAPATPRLVRLDHIVQEHIRSVLIACDGNKLRASEVLGISRSTLYRMLDSTDATPDLRMAG